MIRVWESGGGEKLFFTGKKVFLLPPGPLHFSKKAAYFVEGMIVVEVMFRRFAHHCGYQFFLQ